MANKNVIEAKAAVVSDIQDKLSRAKSVVVFDYRGITVDQDTALRTSLRKEGVEYVVLKNHLVKRACEANGIDASIDDMLHGPSAFAFGYDDATTPAKLLKKFVQDSKKCEIKGGIVEGKVTSADDMKAIADLPSREVLIARMLGSMLSPVTGLAIVLDQIAKKQEGAAE